MRLYLLWLIITIFFGEKPPNTRALGFRETFTYIPRPDSLMFVRIVIPGDENTRDAELGCFSQNNANQQENQKNVVGLGWFQQVVSPREQH